MPIAVIVSGSSMITPPPGRFALRRRDCRIGAAHGKAKDESMALFDEPAKKPAPVHEIGQDLSLLSVDELTRRVGILKDEVVRLEAELAAKGSSKAAAEALFKR
jgi:uncharacterized small protein (DUF1192 family)